MSGGTDQLGRVVEAHKHSSNHRAEIDSSNLVGCFYCRQTYTPSLVEEWVDEESTALCPKCGIDAVIGDASGYPVSEKTFLAAMHGFWF